MSTLIKKKLPASKFYIRPKGAIKEQARKERREKEVKTSCKEIFGNKQEFILGDSKYEFY